MEAKPFRKVRKRKRIVKLTPPRHHTLPLVTGGLNQLYENIRNKGEEVDPDIELVFSPNDYTDEEGVFSPSSDMPLLAERYKYVEVIGQGQSSVLIKAKDMFKDGESVAIKILHLKYAMLGNQETHCLACLNRADPYDFSGTLRILTTFMYADHYCMVFGYLEPKPLHHYFVKMKKSKDYPMILKNIRKVTLHLLKSIGFLQQQNVIHADLKPDNILLQDGKDLASLKLVDFGNAIRCVHEELRLYYEDFELQTLLYRSPEVMFGVHFGLEIDMWSMGCILAELYTGSPIFYGRDKESILRKMISILGPAPSDLFQRGKLYPELSHFTSLSSKKSAAAGLTKALGPTADYNFVDFLVRLLQYDPAKRMTVAEAITHPFLALEMPFKYMMPQGSNGEPQGYDSVFLDKTSYTHGPYVNQDIQKLCMSSIDLLNTGTGGSCRKNPNPLLPEESNVRKIAQVTPVKRFGKVEVVSAHHIDLTGTQAAEGCPGGSQTETTRETGSSFMANNNLEDIMKEIAREEIRPSTGTGHCLEMPLISQSSQNVQPESPSGYINGANMYKRKWKSPAQTLSQSQLQRSAVNRCDENRNVCSINPAQQSNASLPNIVLNDSSSDKKHAFATNQSCDIKNCIGDKNGWQMSPHSPVLRSQQEAQAPQDPSAHGHKIRRKLAKHSSSFNPSPTIEFPFCEKEEFNIPEMKRQKTYEKKLRRSHDTFTPVLKGEVTFCNPSNAVTLLMQPTSAEGSKETTTFSTDEEYRKNIRKTDSPKYGRVRQTVGQNKKPGEGIPMLCDVFNAPGENQNDHLGIVQSVGIPAGSYVASSGLSMESSPKYLTQLPSDDRTTPMLLSVSDDDKSNGSTKSITSSEQDSPPNGDYCDVSDQNGASQDESEGTSSDDDVILLPSLDM